MTAYVVASAASVLAGWGLARRFPTMANTPGAILLSPFCYCAFTTLCLCVGMRGGLPVQGLCQAVWALTAVLAVDGLLGLRKKHLACIAFLGFAAVLTLTLFPASMAGGLSADTGSDFSDKWFYLSKAQYFWDNPQASVVRDSPLYQLAAFYPFRYGSSLLLAWLGVASPSPGLAVAAAGPFLAWTVFLYAASVAYFCLASGLVGNAAQTICCLLLAPASCWTLNTLWANNYDNLLALAILPALAGLLLQTDPGRKSDALAAGLFLAFSVYAYFELSALCFVAAACLALGRAMADRRFKAWFGFVATSLLACLVLLLPAAGDIADMLAVQTAAVTAPGAPRPGDGYYPGLLSLPLLGPTLLGLVAPLQPLPPAARTPTAIAAGLALLAMGTLALRGAAQAVQGRTRGLVLFAAVLAAVLAVVLLVFRYEYAASKIINLGWWLFCFFVVVGAWAPAQRLWVIAAACCIGATGLYGYALHRAHAADNALARHDYGEFAKLEQIPVGDASGFILVTGADKDRPWIAYFLRKRRLLLFGWENQLFSSHFTRRNDQKADFDKTSAVLCDTPGLLGPAVEPLWQSGSLVLYPFGHPRLLLDKVVNRNGEEHWGGGPWHWLGQGDTVLDVYADYVGEARLTASLKPGPAVIGQAPASVAVTVPETGFCADAAMDATGMTVVVPVVPGKNRVQLSPRAQTDPARQPPGDPRPLLFGMSRIRLQPVVE